MDDLLHIGLPRRERGWRSLEELAGEPAEPGEFAPGVDRPPEGQTRREFLQLLGITAALGASGCARVMPSKILPYGRDPEHVIPGVPTWYATSMMLDGYATGLLVESHEGRPTKIEGNPDHPSSLGGSGMLEQASVLGLYDPQRARRLLLRRQPATWDALCAHLSAERRDRGARLRILLEPTSSPLIHAMLGRVRARYPEAKVTCYASWPHRNGVEAARIAFGQPLLPQFDFSRADVVLSLDADFLGEMPNRLRHARDFARRRRISKPSEEMNRLYVVETMPSVTGGMADHRLRRAAADVALVAGAIAAELPRLPGQVRKALAALADGTHEWASVVARDLVRRPPGTTLVLGGSRQPREVRAIAAAMNFALGNIGKTVRYVEPVIPEPDESTQSLEELVGELRAGKVETLLVLDANPVYTAPPELEVAEAIGRAPDTIALAAYEDETAGACQALIPAAHYLESWGDGRAYDGTRSLQQPLIRTLFGGKTIAEVLAALAGDRSPDGHRLLLEEWHRQGGDDASFDRALERGLVPGTASPERTTTLQAGGMVAAADRLIRPPREPLGVELDFYLSPTLYDGRFANNPWLLEQPDPITKLTWDNAAMMSPATARVFDIRNQQMIEIERAGRRVRLPALIVPGHADHAVSLLRGWGHRAPGTFRDGAGFDVGPLTDEGNDWFALGGHLTPLPTRYPLAHTQNHFRLEDRPIALRTTLDEYRRDPRFTAEEKGEQPSLYPPVSYTGLQWAMSIDLTICTGCSACMVACQSENNVLVVGKQGVLNSREMHWLRIDSYYTGPAAEPEVVHQPMLCQHCEDAPCEYVCPVNATVHSSDGLNEMVYNRCVGTRFCSNNCPYKVRRFNWFDWTDREPYNQGEVQLHYNPDVTVRDRGVMEKCSYCVQRIRHVEIQAKIEHREVRPGEVMTACQQACPTGAIQFGSLSHPTTEMFKWRHEPRSYEVLHDLDTRPRTVYLARIDNPNPELEEKRR